MSDHLTHLLASKKMAIILLVVYALLMAGATILEKFQGTPVAKALIYYSPLFIFLQLLMIVNFLLMSVQHHLFSRKKWAYLTIHGAFIVILGGALVTHLFGEEGMMHLREGQRSNLLLLKEGDGQEIRELPFEIELTDFKLTRYPGSQSPSSYESYLQLHVDGVTTTKKVYMNNVLDLKGYRFYQASYDQDEKGSILSVNHDPVGRYITYTGYALLFLGWILLLGSKHSRFRRLWQQLRYVLVPALFFGAGMLPAGAQDLRVPEAHAEKFGALPMQSHNGRIVPVNTFAHEVVRKLKADDVIGDLSAEQFLLSVLAFPADWSLIPLVEVKEKDIAEDYGWQQERISYRDAFDSNNYYRLHQEMEVIYMKNPAARTRRDKELLKIDDRINLLNELLSARMLRLFPNPADTTTLRWSTYGEIRMGETTMDTVLCAEAAGVYEHYIKAVRAALTSHDWSEADRALEALAHHQVAHEHGALIVPAKLRAEVYYNELNLPRLCQIGYLIAGFLLLLLTFNAQHGMPGGKKRLPVLLLLGIGVVFFVLHTLCLGMRWYISGYAPWSNSYETMVSLAWAGVLCGFIFARRNLLVTALAILFGGSVLFVSSLNWMDPQITPLVPVLKSPWLMAHVASLVLAYGFLGISAMIGTAYLLLPGRKTPERVLTQLTVINELSMTLGTALLSVGIFLGAIWANESWGRYWSWDPKETWALITLVVYAIVLHYRWFWKDSRPAVFHLLSQWAVLSILMTFLGVNYFLSGMHSYGSHDALSSIPLWVYLLFVAFFVVPALVKKLKG